MFKLIPQGGCWINLPEDIQKNYLGKSYLSGGGKRGILYRLSMEKPSLTLLCTPSQKQTERCHPIEERPLRISEYARIQSFDDDFDFFISKMIFGDTGANSGVPKQVLDSMDSLFGPAVSVRPVIANIDPNNETQVVFTAVIPFDDISNNKTINEMALKLNGAPGGSGDGLYSMATFAGISKTTQMQITWNWRLSFI